MSTTIERALGKTSETTLATTEETIGATTEAWANDAESMGEPPSKRRVEMFDPRTTNTPHAESCPQTTSNKPNKSKTATPNQVPASAQPADLDLAADHSPEELKAIVASLFTPRAVVTIRHYIFKLGKLHRNSAEDFVQQYHVMMSTIVDPAIKTRIAILNKTSCQELQYLCINRLRRHGCEMRSCLVTYPGKRDTESLVAYINELTRPKNKSRPIQARRRRPLPKYDGDDDEIATNLEIIERSKIVDDIPLLTWTDINEFNQAYLLDLWNSVSVPQAKPAKASKDKKRKRDALGTADEAT